MAPQFNGRCRLYFFVENLKENYPENEKKKEKLIKKNQNYCNVNLIQPIHICEGFKGL